MPKASESLKQLLYDIRRIEEHREILSEKKIRKIYKSLIKDLQGFLGEYYAKYADDSGGLSIGILQGKMKYAKFLEEIVNHVDSFTPKIQQEILKTVKDTYKACYDGMVKAVNSANGDDVFKDTNLHAQTMKRAIENPISGLTLPDTLEKQRKDVIYEIKQAINIGLVNGDRYDTVAKKVTERIDIDYRKAITTARTESHRVREAGFNDSATDIQSKIQGSGLVFAAIWRTMKDERVRPQHRYKTKKGWKTTISKNGANHQKMEGQIVVSGEKFDLGGGVMAAAPGNSGDAKNDIRCRCFLEYELMSEEEFLQKGGKLPEKWFTNDHDNGIINKKADIIVTGHDSTPKKSTPNSIIDHVTDAKVDTRTFYNQNGIKQKDIHTTNHGNPKTHHFGQYGEHAHDYEWDAKENLKSKTIRELTEQERKENGDIL